MKKKKVFWIGACNGSGNHLLYSLVKNKIDLVDNDFEEIILNYIFYKEKINLAIFNKNLEYGPEKILKKIFYKKKIQLSDKRINLDDIFILLKKYFYSDKMIIFHTNFIKEYEFYLYTKNKKKYFINNIIIKKFFLILKKFLFKNNYNFETIILFRNPINILLSNRNKHKSNQVRSKWSEKELQSEINKFLLSCDLKNKKIYYEELIKKPGLLESIFKININKIKIFKFRNYYYSLNKKKYNMLKKKFFYYQSKKIYHFEQYKFLKFKFYNFVFFLISIYEEIINLKNFQNNKNFYYHTNLNLMTKIFIKLLNIKVTKKLTKE